MSPARSRPCPLPKPAVCGAFSRIGLWPRAPRNLKPARSASDRRADSPAGRAEVTNNRCHLDTAFRSLVADVGSLPEWFRDALFCFRDATALKPGLQATFHRRDPWGPLGFLPPPPPSGPTRMDRPRNPRRSRKPPAPPRPFRIVGVRADGSRETICELSTRANAETFMRLMGTLAEFPQLEIVEGENPPSG